MKSKNIISKQIWIWVPLLLLFAACTKNFQNINTPTSGEPASTISISQLATDFFSHQMGTSEYIADNNVYYPISQQGAMYKVSDYGIGTGSAADGPGNDWNNFYQQLGDYRLILSKMGGDSAKTYYNNLVFMLKVLNSYQVIKVSNFYGSMPYSQAGYAVFGPSQSNYYPTYDSQKVIYETAVTDLASAVDSFNTSTSGSQFPMTGIDVVLLNNIPQWIKFANSIRLRAAVSMYAKDPGFAGPQIADALNKPLLTDYSVDNVGIYPANVPGADFTGRSMSQECYLRMGTVMWEQMSSNNDSLGGGIFDPRCALFFEPNGLGHWVPIPQCPNPLIPDGGAPYSTARYSQPGWGLPITGNNFAGFNVFWGADMTIPDLFITAAQVHFLKAEAYLSGMGVPAEMSLAQTEYNAGVTGSVNFWTSSIMNSPQWVVNKPASLPSQAVMNTFLNTAQVAFDMSNTDHALSQIYAQEWIDLFRQPWEAWTLQRRTGATPTETNPANFGNYAGMYGIYQRMTYPVSESTDNEANWITATGGNSGDVTTNKIWIAK
jgi:Starch-binding associating with outer membrane